MDHCCHIRHYIFSIKKCGTTHCTICKPPRLPKEIFDTLHHLPDPVRDGDVYKKISHVYETNTTEKDRPSLQSSADKCDSGIPFNPSGRLLEMLQECYNVQSAINRGCCILPVNFCHEMSKSWIVP